MESKRHKCSRWTTFNCEWINRNWVGRIDMICKICGEETDNSDGICIECKFSVIDLDGI